MTEAEYISKFPWVSPTIEGDYSTMIDGVKAATGHVAVCKGAGHKAIPCMAPIHSAHLDRVDGLEWELFTVSHRGFVNGTEFVWGMFVEGLGMFNVMAPVEHIRELLPHEREAWSKVRLGMFGSHSDKMSYSLPSGVKP